MAQTSIYGLPYQTLTDPPNGPNLGQQLAQAVETQLQRIDNDVTALETPTLVVLRATIGQTIPNAAWTALALDTEEFDTSNWHSTSSNTSRLTPTIPCKLVVVGTAVFFTSSTGNKGVRIAKNGAPALGRQVFGPPSANELWSQQAFAILSFNGTTDYVEVQGFQVSGANLATFNNSEFAPAMQAYLIARG